MTHQHSHGVPRFVKDFVLMRDPDGTLTPGACRVLRMQMVSDLTHGAYLDGTIWKTNPAGRRYVVQDGRLVDMRRREPHDAQIPRRPGD